MITVPVAAVEPPSHEEKMETMTRTHWRQFLSRRLTPGEAAGLTLTLGAAAVLALGVGFGELLDNVLDGDGVAVADRPVLQFIAAHRQPWLITTARVISDVGSPVGVAVTVAVVGVALAWRRLSWLPLVILLLGTGGIGMINMTVKHLVSRNRPPLAEAVAGEQGFSFPSGHTTGTTVVWLLTAWLASRVLGSWTGRLAVRTGALLMIGAVGATRVYLGVHFPSDVLAGWALGAAWAITIALVVNVWEARRTAPAGPRLRLRLPSPDR
jgi:membrane-associated phospholipid phosphatase